MLHGDVAYLQLAKPSILEYLRCTASDRRVTHVSQQSAYESGADNVDHCLSRQCSVGGVLVCISTREGQDTVTFLKMRKWRAAADELAV